MNTYAYLDEQAHNMHRSGDPDEPFYYLAGPMTGIPQFNFPEFIRIAEQLRDSGLNIISPAEIDDDDVADVVAQDDTGLEPSVVAQRVSFLERDILICTMPTCLGGIFIPGWEASAGAGLESFVLEQLGKQLLRYVETDDLYYLEKFRRDQALHEHDRAQRRLDAQA